MLAAPAMVHAGDDLFHHPMGRVDMAQGAPLQSAVVLVVFLFFYVVMSLVQEFEGPVIAVRLGQMCVNRGMVVKVLVIVNGGALDLANCAVNFTDGALLFIVHLVIGAKLVQKSSGVAQVAKRMQVSGMFARSIGGCGWSGKNASPNDDEQCDETALESFHGNNNPLSLVCSLQRCCQSVQFLTRRDV